MNNAHPYTEPDEAEALFDTFRADIRAKTRFSNKARPSARMSASQTITADLSIRQILPNNCNKWVGKSNIL